MATTVDKNNVTRALKDLKDSVCSLGNNSAIEDLLQELVDTLKKQDELTQIKFCEEGVVTGYVIKIWDEATNTFGQDIYLDSSGATVSTPPAGTVCSGQDVCDDKTSVGTVLDWNVIKD